MSAILVVPAWGDDEPLDEVPRVGPQLFAPPLFALDGQAKDVRAFVPGEPDSVQLVVRQQGSNEPVQIPMEPTNEELWLGTIPADVVGRGELGYSVTAAYADVTNESAAARLVVLDGMRSSTPTLLAAGGTTLLEMPLGSGANELGVRGGKESATELPPAFVMDEARERVHILDSVKSRVISTDLRGRVRERRGLPNGSTSQSDIILGADATLLVLDQARDEVIEVTNNKQRVYSSVGSAKRTRGARLAFDHKSATLYASDALQGRFVPLVKRGRNASREEQSTQVVDGVPSSIGSLAAEVNGNSVLFGLDAGRNTGYRVDFADQVLDATEVVVDGAGMIFGLVGVYREQESGVVAYLVRVDPSTGSSTATRIGASVFGDVTRRLTAAKNGVVLLEGTRKTISLVRHASN